MNTNVCHASDYYTNKYTYLIHDHINDELSQKCVTNAHLNPSNSWKPSAFRFRADTYKYALCTFIDTIQRRPFHVGFSFMLDSSGFFPAEIITSFEITPRIINAKLLIQWEKNVP